MNLNIVEIFSSIQGEGLHTGQLVTFVRLAGCNMNCPFCDTDWQSNQKQMSLSAVLREVRKYPSNVIVWTGGEPLLQLKEECLFFGYKHYLETNGSLPPIKGLDYITISPKVPTDMLNKNFRGFWNIGEIRYPIKVGDVVPNIDELPIARNYYLSPIFDGDKLIIQNVKYCMELIERRPRWRLSVQTHKLLNLT
jgi:7-carboxy-7-deazaguanine synthase